MILEAPAPGLNVRAALEEQYPDDELLLFEPGEVYDAAIAGVATRIGGFVAVAYWHDELVAALMRDGMTEEEALEWVGHNTTGAWLGPQTPIILHRLASVA